MAQNGEAETVKSGALAHDSRGRESSETGALGSPTNVENRAPEASRLDAREALNARNALLPDASRVTAGAIEWREARGYSSAYVRLCTKRCELERVRT